ncbi:MAG TPA: hypothetical protein VMR50_03405 [Myxococcota bacterium]|nr:hypothetical protein [Myxococcota bacterium]
MRSALLLATAFALTGCFGPRIDVSPMQGFYAVTSSTSDLVVILPREDLELMDKTDEGRCFHLESADLSVHGCFRPGEEYLGLDAYFRNTGERPPPVDAKGSKIGEAEMLQWQETRNGKTTAHAVAHWVKLGSWVELNVWTRADDGPRKLKSYLREVVVKKN